MSEKELGQKWDRCLSDCAIKVGAGLGIGIVFSVVFFKRRTMPIAFGTGVGLGMAYSNCQNDLKTPYLLHSNVQKVSLSVEDGERSSYTISPKVCGNRLGMTPSCSNMTAHEALSIKTWMSEFGCGGTSQSPELNLIEHLWDELERRLRAGPSSPTSLPDLTYV